MDNDRHPEHKTQRIECECGRTIWATQYQNHINSNQHYRSMTKHSGIPYRVYGETGTHEWRGGYDDYDVYDFK